MSSGSYKPLQNGIEQKVSKNIDYHEFKPNHVYSDLVHCFWSLKSKELLNNDFTYIVLPDACIDIVFDVKNSLEPIIMTPKMEAETINLGKEFHYVGIRFKPGVFSKQLNILDVIGEQHSLKDIISLQVPALNNNSYRRHNKNMIVELQAVVQKIVDAQILKRNTYIENIIRGLQYGLTVGAIAAKLTVSERQLRRGVQQQTGFSPVQLRRVIRFQSVLSSGEPLLRFADQSHLIKEFKSVTGRSYGSYLSSNVDVRKVQF